MLICPECGTHSLANDTKVSSRMNELDIVRCNLCGRRFHAQVTLTPVENEEDAKAEEGRNHTNEPR